MYASSRAVVVNTILLSNVYYYSFSAFMLLARRSVLFTAEQTCPPHCDIFLYSTRTPTMEVIDDRLANL